MAIHEIKIEPIYFNQIKSGMKSYELRYNDREYRVGDKLVLHECYKNVYTGRKISRLIVNLLREYPGLVSGWVILSLGSLNRSNRQNNYYWSQMERLATLLPEEERTSLGWHEHLKEQILGIKEIYVRGNKIPFSTAWLSSEDFNWYLRQANDWVLRRYGVEFEESVMYKYREWRKLV